MPTRDQIQRLLSLSKREREVLACFCQKMEYKEIAEKLVIAQATVRSHMGHIYLKLGLSELNDRDRLLSLMTNFCPLLNMDLIEDDEDDQDDSTGDSVRNESKALIPIPPKVQRQVDMDEKALILLKKHQEDFIEGEFEIITPTSNPARTDPEPTRNDLRTVVRVVTSFSLLVIAVGFVIFIVNNLRGPVNSSSDSENTPISGAVLEQITQTPTSTILAKTSTATTAPTNTSPPPTDTPAPTKGPWEKDWDYLGFEGEVFGDIVDSNGVIYISTNKYSHGIYRSIDWGKSWTARNNGLEELNIRQLGVSSIGPNEVYARGKKLWFSDNGGETWINITPPGDGDVHGFAIGSEGGRTIYASGDYFDWDQKLFYSYDSGSTWYEAFVCVLGCAEAGWLYISPSNWSVMIAQNYYVNDRIEITNLPITPYKDWAPIAGIGTGLIPNDIEFSYHNSSVIYASTEYGIYKSSDTAGSWLPINNGIYREEGKTTYDCVDIEPVKWDENLLFTSCNGFLYRSEDGGDSWEYTPSPYGATHIHVISDQRMILIGTESSGLYYYDIP